MIVSILLYLNKESDELLFIYVYQNLLATLKRNHRDLLLQYQYSHLLKENNRPCIYSPTSIYRCRGASPGFKCSYRQN